MYRRSHRLPASMVGCWWSTHVLQVGIHIRAMPIKLSEANDAIVASDLTNEEKGTLLVFVGELHNEGKLKNVNVSAEYPPPIIAHALLRTMRQGDWITTWIKYVLINIYCFLHSFHMLRPASPCNSLLLCHNMLLFFAQAPRAPPLLLAPQVCYALMLWHVIFVKGTIFALMPGNSALMFHSFVLMDLVICM